MIEATRPLGVRTAAPSPRRILMAGGALVFAGTFVWQFSPTSWDPVGTVTSPRSPG